MTYSPLSQSRHPPIIKTCPSRIKSATELRNYDLARGISQESLAHLADLDRTYVNSVENGKRNISIENIEKIAKALKISIKEFFDDKRFS